MCNLWKAQLQQPQELEFHHLKDRVALNLKNFRVLHETASNGSGFQRVIGLKENYQKNQETQKKRLALCCQEEKLKYQPPHPEPTLHHQMYLMWLKTTSRTRSSSSISHREAQMKLAAARQHMLRVARSCLKASNICRLLIHTSYPLGASQKVCYVRQGGASKVDSTSQSRWQPDTPDMR